MSEIDEIKDAAGAYRRWALEARKKYIELRLRQDPEIRGLYIRAADRVAKELRHLALKTPSSYLRKRQLEELEAALRMEAERLGGNFAKAMENYIEEAVNAGAGYSQAVMMDLFKKAGIDTAGLRAMYARVNRQAVEACWARTKKGLFLSDRIWHQGENFRNTMRDLIQESVAIGQDAVKTARMLQQYVRQGVQTLARDYPKMMERMKGRIPGDICYEALRLARTETTAAFGEGTIAAARVSPSYKGMKWVLSKSHPITDICDTLAAHDEGLGEGVYSPGNEPPYPAHPNCLCVLVPVHEEPEEFVERLKKWRENPDSDRELEEWYNNIYKAHNGTNDKQKIKEYVQIEDLTEEVKNNLAKALRQAIEFGKEKGLETLLHISANYGSEVFERLVGGKSSVNFTPELISFLENAAEGSVISIHNHPNSSSFSDADLSVLSKFKSIKYLCVIGHDGTRYLVKVGKGKRPSYQELRDDYIKAEQKYFKYFYEKVMNNEMTEDEAWYEHSHLIVKDLAQKYNWEYRRVKPNEE